MLTVRMLIIVSLSMLMPLYAYASPSGSFTRGAEQWPSKGAHNQTL